MPTITLNFLPDLSAPVAAFATCVVCLALAGLMIVACYDAERLPPLW
jgi:hypothetical protein